MASRKISRNPVTSVLLYCWFAPGDPLGSLAHRLVLHSADFKACKADLKSGGCESGEVRLECLEQNGVSREAFQLLSNQPPLSDWKEIAAQNFGIKIAMHEHTHASA